uniref:Transposase n=1 Tax=Candidatus Kentrum sp. FM TaxID=2126340 RepID=A0A450WAM0_9GAMM|nr:MAG: Transposase [Candidatus Kentron sp. FM]
MTEKKKRKVHSPEYKAKVGLEALKGVKTINEIGQEYGVHPVQVGQWKKAIQEDAKSLFEVKRGPKPVVEHQEPERLYSEIGKLKMELGDWQKRIYQIAQDFRSDSRRNNRRIVNYVTVIATQKLDDKDKQVGIPKSCNQDEFM